MTFSMQVITKKSRFIAVATAGIVVINLGGCSSNVAKPVGELASAETAISHSEYNGARKYAPVELDRANSKLLEAYQEFKQENYRKAERLANEALVDANLATAKTTAVKTTKATEAMEDSVLLLQESLKKNYTR